MQLQGAGQRSTFRPMVPVAPLWHRAASLDPSRCRHLQDSKAFLKKDSTSRQRAVIARAEDGHGAKVTEMADSLDTLRDPAHVWAAKSTEVAVNQHDGEFGLEAYMRLPVAQYNVLDPKLIEFVGGNRFQFHVPRVTMLNVWVEPTATVAVEHKANPPCVVLTTEGCNIQGSELLESLNMDKRFCMSFTATLTWQSPGPSTKGRSILRPRRADNSPRICVDARLDIWSEVLPPFTLLPRPVLEGSCNLALKALMQVLLPMFMNKLGADYGEWAMDADYRERRAAINLQASAL